uniref:Uncharacterized protein n=1 Tax=Nelumbo nucifera TaxID=4432 RepID=A0A822Y8G8_NELNU|nr:TPA_asm: hypothetical protein HUJ06_030185 [Nelumbo nucifera]
MIQYGAYRIDTLNHGVDIEKFADKDVEEGKYLGMWFLGGEAFVHRAFAEFERRCEERMKKTVGGKSGDVWDEEVEGREDEFVEEE